MSWRMHNRVAPAPLPLCVPVLSRAGPTNIEESPIGALTDRCFAKTEALQRFALCGLAGPSAVDFLSGLSGPEQLRGWRTDRGSNH
jgi:hypothetical protein